MRMSTVPSVLGDGDEEGDGDNDWLREYLADCCSPEPEAAAAAHVRNADFASLAAISPARTGGTALPPEVHPGQGASLPETAYNPAAMLASTSFSAMQGAAEAHVPFFQAVGSSSSCGAPLHNGAGSGSPLTGSTPPAAGEQVLRCCGLYNDPIL